MKHFLTTMCSIFLIFGFAAAGSAGDKLPVNGEIIIGGSVGDTGTAGSFSEYESVADKNGNIILGGKLSYPSDKIRLNFYGNYEDGDTQAYGGNVDLNRILQVETDYIRFMHRLDHDNLDHMIATLGKSSQGATVYHTDFNPSDNYSITRSTWKNHAKLKIPQFPGLVLTFNNKYDQRKGMEQARTMSKCASCHVVAKSKMINEITQEFNPGIQYHFGIFDIEYSFKYQTFDAKGDDPSNLYMKVQNPGADGKNPDFDQRVQFGDQALDFSRTPDSEKFSHKVKVKASMDNSTVNLGSVYSKATNNSSDRGDSALNGNIGEELSVDFYAVNSGWHWRINKKMRLTVKGKYQKQNADEVFVDVNDQIQVAGPGAGETYAGFLGTDFDHERASAYDKEIYAGNIKYALRISKKIKMNLGYNIEHEDRKNAKGLHLVDDTTTHEFSIGNKYKPTRKLRMNVDYKYTYVQNPYVFHHALCPDQPEDYDPGTYSPESWYSKYVYGSRTASSTNRPGQIHEAKLKTFWSPSNKISTNAYVRYKYAINDDADLNDWKQHSVNSGIGGMYAISSKAEISFGYNFFYDKYAATFCSAYYHG